MQDAVVSEVRAAIARSGIAPRTDPRGGADRGESALRHRGRRTIHRGPVLAGDPPHREGRARTRAVARGGHPPAGLRPATRHAALVRRRVRGVHAADARGRNPARRVGVDEAAAVAGVTGVTIAVPVGESVTPLPEGDRYLGFIFGSGSRARRCRSRAPEGSVAPSRVSRLRRISAALPPGGIEPPSTG